jgi:predicted dehydrogenase
MTIRVGLVGCGHIGTVHSFALGALVKAGLVDVVVTATADADLERARATAVHHDATAYAALDELLDHVDVVWICTWTAAHREAVLAATSRGIAVFCEKPLAPTLDECEELAAALARVAHQVGLVLRHAPVFRAAAELVASGLYGRPLAAVLRDDQFFPIQGMYGSDWRADVTRAGGGTLIEHSIHDVDVLRWILGEPATVRGHVAELFGHSGIDDVAEVTFTYESGAVATLVSVWHQVLSRPSTRRLEVFCERAMLWTDDDYLGPLHVETDAGEELIVASPPAWLEALGLPEVLAKPLAQYAEPTKSFLDALSRGDAPPAGWPDAETALAAHRLVDLAYRSSAGGGSLEHVSKAARPPSPR